MRIKILPLRLLEFETTSHMLIVSQARLDMIFKGTVMIGINVSVT